MTGQADTPARPGGGRHRSGAVLTIQALVLLYAFLVGVGSLGDGFELLGGDLLDSFFQSTSNPFIALMVGMLSTSIIQSSSVTTSLVVGLVAAPENPLPLANAVPIIMGANIGTTVTNTLVSIAHMRRAGEFRRAFAVATCHDFFNYLAVLILLPVEMLTGFLSRSSDWIAVRVLGTSGVEFESPIGGLIKAGGRPVKGLSEMVFDSPQAQGAMIVICAALLIFAALFFFVMTMRNSVGQSATGLIQRALGRNALLAMLIGMVATMMVQSSSITTSLLVPIAAAGMITLEQAFPVTLGANVGTTITALLAALAVSGPNAHFGIAIALTHSLFNIVGVLIIYPVPFIRWLPLAAARNLASFAVRHKTAAIAYVGIMFYGIPALFALLYR